MSEKIVESIIAGDMLFRDVRHPGIVDLQQTAFQEAMRAVAKNISKADKALARVLFMFDQVGGWEDHIAEGVSRNKARSPHLHQLSPEFSYSLQGIAKQFGVNPEIIEAVPEEKLRGVVKELLKKPEIDGEGRSRLRARGVFESQSVKEEELRACDEECMTEGDDEEDASGQKEVVKCRGIASALFLRASVVKSAHHSSHQVDIIKAFFSADSQVPNRVSLQVILDGAVIAQTEWGVRSEIRTYFYTPISALGAAAATPEQIYVVRGGVPSEIK